MENTETLEKLEDNFLGNSEGAQRRRKSVWLISFTDVISLMLAFFVLLFSMKETKEDYWSRVYASLPGEAARFYARQDFSGPTTRTGVEKVEVEPKRFTLNYLEALFKKLLEKDPILSRTTYQRVGSTLVLSLDFDSLAIQKSQQGEVSLGLLVNTMSRVDNQVEILTFIKNQEDWRKSFELSQSIAKILKNSGYNRDILISVYGSNEKPTTSELLQPGTINLLIAE